MNAEDPDALSGEGDAGPGKRWLPWWVRMLLWSAAFAVVLLGAVFLTPKGAYIYYVWKHAEQGHGQGQFIDLKVVDLRPKTGNVALYGGYDQGIREGYVMVIHRGSNYVGRVRIMTVWNDFAGGQIIGAWQAVQVGDNAVVRVKPGPPRPQY